MALLPERLLRGQKAADLSEGTKRQTLTTRCSSNMEHSRIIASMEAAVIMAKRNAIR